jgi:hypothetical protein
MRDLPLPTFPIAGLDSPWRLGARLRAPLRDKPSAAWWAAFRPAVARALAEHRGSDTPPTPTLWERA